MAQLVKLTLLDAFAATERLRPVRADPARVLWQSVDLEAFKPSDKIFEDNFEELLAFVTQWPDHLPSTPDMCCGFSACNDVAQLVPLSHMCKEHRQWVSVNVRILKSLYYHLRRRVAKNGCKSRIACLRICVVPLNHAFKWVCVETLLPQQKQPERNVSRYVSWGTLGL